MRLKQLKLAGFKSFVDPTKIRITSALSAIVGPNGCGKSNIIDAVRWVLGESSAKNLRGEGMTDVIFNGSNARKPVSQASVELIFDNNENKAQGPWQSFSEIAIKRQVHRDGQSDYFVNSQKCRRRDITDLLSGTGLGPRSYSIIEQGTISRLVESKPQELRVFIEEAAGITKYKERRRETENRIKHSRENISRLADLKHELDSQVSKLESQAREAEQYSSLKSHERRLSRDIILLRWKNFQLELEQAQAQLIDKQQQLAQITAELSDNAKDSELADNKKNSLTEQLKSLLQQRYQQETQVAQVNAQVKQLTTQRQQQVEEQDKLKLAHDANINRQTQQRHMVAQARDQVEQLAPTLPRTVTLLETLAQQCRDTELKTEQAEQQLTRCLNQQNSIKQQIELHQHSTAKIAKDEIKLASQRELLIEKRKSCQRERDVLAPQEKTEHYQLLQQQHQESLSKLAAAAEQALQNVSKLESHEQQLLALDNSISKVENRMTTIEMLIAAKLDHRTDEIVSHYQGCPQLWQKLEVEGNWQRAVELVLGDFLQAYCLEQPITSLPARKHRVIAKKTMPATTPGESGGKISPLAQLLSHIRCDYAISSLLCGIYCATDNQQAKEIALSLEQGESVITVDGNWYGQGFVVISGSELSVQVNVGLIELQQQLQQASAELQQLLNNRAEYTEIGTALKQLVGQQQAEQQQCQVSTNKYHEQMVDAKQQWLLEQQKWQHVCDQFQDINRQIVELEQLQQLEQQQLYQLGEQQAELKDQLQLLTESSQDSQNLVSMLQQQLNSERNQYQKLQHQKHDAELNLQKWQMQLNAATTQLSQIDDTVTGNEEQLTKLNLDINQAEGPIVSQTTALAQGQRELQKTRQLHDEAEIDLSKNVTLGQQVQQKLQQYLEKKSQLESDINRVNLVTETLKVKLGSQEQALEISSREVAELAYALVVSNEAKRWPQRLADVKKQLAQIGPINLTAINEYNEQKQRSDILEAQIDDLEQALTTLESAIKKIDRESKEKFKLTFDSVNRDFKMLFPKVFGGGSAQLALTDSDLLSSGVSIMAQPPGKKNSTIHLLSGGEKALTALSLVFAIFQLNPAPFCMLDEVDAPLDDANVERYCNLVKEMSEKVQFIFITHNKVSMEMADHLAGVTMIEAGVSRVVAVDVAQAISLVQE